MFKTHVPPHASHAAFAEVTSTIQPSTFKFPPKSNKWQNDPLVWRIGCGSGVSHCSCGSGVSHCLCGSGVSHCLWRDVRLILHGIIYFYCCKFPFCILYFKLSPCSECCVLYSGHFLGVLFVIFLSDDSLSVTPKKHKY